MARSVRILFDGFLDGFTGAGLFGKLTRPGAPTEFVDSRSMEEFMGSGDFDGQVSRFRAAVAEYEKTNVRGARPSPATFKAGSGVVRDEREQLVKYMSGHR